jgi:hypothetical protein
VVFGLESLHSLFFPFTKQLVPSQLCACFYGGRLQMQARLEHSSICVPLALWLFGAANIVCSAEFFLFSRAA